MCKASLSRELALAIGLAAKALPHTQTKQLINALIDTVGFPLNATKLQSLSLHQYQQALCHAMLYTFSKNDLQISLAYLKSDFKIIPSTSIQPFYPAEMPQSIRVAISSQDGLHIDGQFSSCQSLYIYQVSAQDQRLIDIRLLDEDKAMKAVQKQQYRAEMISDCQVLYSVSIGGSAAAKVVKRGVHPITLKGKLLITDIMEQLQHVLLNSPPPWLAKSMGLTRSPLSNTHQEKYHDYSGNTRENSQPGESGRG